MTKIKETDLTKFCVNLFNSMPNARIVKRLATIARSGEPDLYGILNKYHVEIEMKVNSNMPTELQHIAICRWKELGAISGWANSIISFIQIFEEKTTIEQKEILYKFLNEKKHNILLKTQIHDATIYLKNKYKLYT